MIVVIASSCSAIDAARNTIQMGLIRLAKNAACLQFGEDLREESGLGIYAQHIATQAIHNQQASIHKRNMKGDKGKHSSIRV